MLKTGDLSADWDDDDSLVIVRRGGRLPVPLTKSVLTSIAGSPLFSSVCWMLPSSIADLLAWPSRGDRHTTLLVLNRVLHPEYEIRFVNKSTDGEQVAFVPLSANDWLVLEQQHGSAAVGAAFAPIREHPNFFSEETPSDGFHSNRGG